MIMDVMVARALYVDASLSYLIVILLKLLIHAKNLSAALLIFLYVVWLYGFGFLPFLGFTDLEGGLLRH
jgi:uncharacterized membrane protein